MRNLEPREETDEADIVKVVAALTEPGAIRKYLPGVGLPARAPPMALAGRQPQQEFDIDYAASAA